MDSTPLAQDSSRDAEQHLIELDRAYLVAHAPALGVSDLLERALQSVSS